MTNIWVGRTSKAYWVLAFAFLLSLFFKVSALGVGAPFITIDDQTTFEGGFLVWFGQAPPQHTYLESWLVGSTSLFTYLYHAVTQGHGVGIDLVSDAYRAYGAAPEPFVAAYRAVSLAMDLLTVLLVFLSSRLVFAKSPNRDWLTVFTTSCYLLSFNTIWCNVVARPDIPTTLFAMLGLYFYFRSASGADLANTLLSACAFGVAAGLKLHAVLFVVFILLDLWRLHGFRSALRYGIPFCALAFVFFCLAAGSILFDPLQYVKMRVLNAQDDASPWIHWGDQFVVVLRGSGWLAIALMLVGFFYAKRSKEWNRNSTLSSLFFMGLGWLILFCCIRQLRAYWMLPALPLFYMAASYTIASLKNKTIGMAIGVLMLALLGFQSFQQMQELRAVPYHQLRDWVSKNINGDEPIYILGFESLFLPKSQTVLDAEREGLHRKMDEGISSGEPFIKRHVQMWEEESALKLQDMLGNRAGKGFTYYSYFGTPLKEYAGIVNFQDIKYVLLQEHFSLAEEPELQAALNAEFEPVARDLVGPGGGKKGLHYTVYKRKNIGG